MRNTNERIKERSIVPGRVTDIDYRAVTVDFGYTIKGRFRYSECNGKNPAIGDYLNVFICSLNEDKQGYATLSYRIANIWKQIENAFKKGYSLPCEVKCVCNGGLIVSLFGDMAFLPDRLIDHEAFPNKETMVGLTISVVIVWCELEHVTTIVSQLPKSPDVSTDYSHDVNLFFEWYDLHDDEDDVFTGIPDDDDNIYFGHMYDDEDSRYDEALKNAPPISLMPRTYGSLKCPHCNSPSQAFIDGTALCPKCYRWFYYL